MSRPFRTTAAAVLLGGGLAGFVVLLAGQGLDRAEKWVSLVGVFASVALSAGGLGLGWLTWRHSRTGIRAKPPVNASGAGSVAIGGDSTAEIRTSVLGTRPLAAASADGSAGVSASGAGSVAIGGNSGAPIRTTIAVPDEGSPHS
ncbi:hypothetical protein [Micromonospora sp. S-DT3-3-22]|uniref:hypothetical protein n=1 Tax=Micromonospora sp. S-DT3-3-22 TaxID=2755359 RepID=UPI0018906AE2|nr:hypothetical protein [Micromonospora sp. S-DT3-3-22]